MTLRAGYSLLEVLLAVALIALAAAVSAPALMSGFERYEREQAESMIQGGLIDARTRAVLGGAAVSFDPQILSGNADWPGRWRVGDSDPVLINAAGLCEAGSIMIISPRGRMSRIAVSSPDCRLDPA